MGVQHIALIGAGNIGGTLARTWRAAGHNVTFGARDPSKVRALAEKIGAQVTSPDDAVRTNHVVVFAIPGAAMADTVAGLGRLLDGKVVVDAANNVRGETMHSRGLFSGDVSYVRAFSTLGWEMFERPEVGGVQADLFYCGPEGERELVEELIGDVGLRAVWVGDSDAVEIVDGLTRLWFTLALGQGRGRRLAFKMIQD